MATFEPAPFHGGRDLVQRVPLGGEELSTFEMLQPLRREGGGLGRGPTSLTISGVDKGQEPGPGGRDGFTAAQDNTGHTDRGRERGNVSIRSP